MGKHHISQVCYRIVIALCGEHGEAALAVRVLMVGSFPFSFTVVIRWSNLFIPVDAWRGNRAERSHVWSLSQSCVQCQVSISDLLSPSTVSLLSPDGPLNRPREPLPSGVFSGEPSRESRASEQPIFWLTGSRRQGRDTNPRRLWYGSL